MKKTTLFEKAFKKVLKKKKTAEEDENSTGGGALGPTAAAGYGTTVSGTPGTDSYAPGDFRRPTALGATYSRNGKVGKKKKKTRKSKNKK
tara:strand:- start:1240 stop:1509 length:270 start_codon:yes stop_codon:yes gene_type:complete